MDILKIFSLLENEDGESHHINIQGTVDDPLFQANQIGKILGISNIRDSLKDFGEDERSVVLTDTLGGKQETNFLTELGPSFQMRDLFNRLRSVSLTDTFGGKQKTNF